MPFSSVRQRVARRRARREQEREVRDARRAAQKHERAEQRAADRTERDAGRHRAAQEDGPREVVNIAWRPPQRPVREPGEWGHRAALAGVLLLGALMGYVSYWTQRAMVFDVKHDMVIASLEALGPDLGAFIFAALGHAQARRGRRALVSRLLSMGCVAAAIAMNVLSVGVDDVARLAVAVLPPLLYATASDRLIAVTAEQNRTDVAQPVGDDRSAWLVLLRWALGLPSAFTGLRAWVLDNVSPSPGPSAAELRAAAEIATAQQQREDADAAVREARQWAETTVGQQVEQQRAALAAAQRAHAEETARLRADLGEARAAAENAGGTKKDVLLRLYAQLGLRGDPRHGDRAYVAEVAAELAPAAGDLHVKTAEKYLREYLTGEESPQINGRIHPDGERMIGVTG